LSRCQIWCCHLRKTYFRQKGKGSCWVGS
jgi:hypothetical protein